MVNQNFEMDFSSREKTETTDAYKMTVGCPGEENMLQITEVNCGIMLKRNVEKWKVRHMARTKLAQDMAEYTVYSRI
jgi:hypothetical protein